MRTKGLDKVTRRRRYQWNEIQSRGRLTANKIIIARLSGVSLHLSGNDLPVAHRRRRARLPTQTAETYCLVAFIPAPSSLTSMTPDRYLCTYYLIPPRSIRFIAANLRPFPLTFIARWSAARVPFPAPIPCSIIAPLDTFTSLEITALLKFESRTFSYIGHFLLLRVISETLQTPPHSNSLTKLPQKLSVTPNLCPTSPPTYYIKLPSSSLLIEATRPHLQQGSSDSAATRWNEGTACPPTRPSTEPSKPGSPSTTPLGDLRSPRLRAPKKGNRLRVGARREHGPHGPLGEARIFMPGTRRTRRLERGHAARPQFVRVFKRAFRAFLSLAALSTRPECRGVFPGGRIYRRRSREGETRTGENTGSRQQIKRKTKGGGQRRRPGPIIAHEGI